MNNLALFGSAVTSQFDPVTSDFDLTVRFGTDPSRNHADQFFGLKEFLEDLLQRSVDLVEDDFVKNKYFRQELDEKAVNLYSA